MMSATTAFSETPATLPSAASAGAGGTTAGAPATPNEFQNLLAGAVVEGTQTALDQTLPTAAPGQSIAQMFGQKTVVARAQALPLQATTGTDASAGEMLDLLEQSAALLPEAPAIETDAAPDELLETHETVKAEDDVLSDWLNVLIPYSVLAQQAGSGSAETNADGSAAGGKGESQADGAIPSLKLQAGTSDVTLPPVAAQSTPGTVVTLERAPGTAQAAQNAVAAITTNLAPTAKTESTERAPSGDEWMNAFGDLTAKRTQDVNASAATRIPTPVHDSRWADALAHRLVMMAREGESVAQLRLVPQELGPLDIQITVKDGDASVHFGAPHAETRSALEASLPRLRELLSAQGLQLSNASVSHQSGGSKTPERAPAVNGVSGVAEEGEVAPAKVVSTSLLDIYA